ncbi:UNVERIFIED_CONTAM: cyoB [Trichonephila clavipes]
MLLGKLSWDAIPNDPIVLVTMAAMAVGGIALVAALTYFKLWKYLWTEWLTSVDHKKLGIMYIVVSMVMLLRGFADAIMMRLQLALAAGGGADLHRPWRDHDLLRGHGPRGRSHEHRRAAADRCPRRGLPAAEQLQLLDVRCRCRLRHDLPCAGRVRRHRLAGVSATIGHRVQSGRGGRLLHLGLADLRSRHFADRRQLHRHHHQDACARHEADGHADLHLDRALRRRADRRRLPGADGHPGHADRRPLLRHALLHQRSRRQPDAVRQPDLDLGPPRGLHPGAAGLRRVLGSRGHLLRQAPVRLQVHGLRHGVDRGAVVRGLGAPLLHHGRRSQRQCLLRHHDHDHRHPDRGEDLQLAVHHVQGPHPVHGADAVDHGLPGHVHHRWHDRRAAGGSAGRLRGPQLAVPDRALPQRDHRRRGVRHVRRPDLLVPEDVRLHAERNLGQAFVLVLAGRFLPGLHAAVRARLHGHDAPPEQLQQPGLGPVPERGLRRRRTDRPGHPVHADPDLRQCPRPQAEHGCHRRPVERPYPGVGNLLAGAVLQLRPPAQRGRHRCVLGRQGKGRRLPEAGQVRGCPHADQPCRRHCHDLLHLGLRFRHGLAHLVAGRGRPGAVDHFPDRHFLQQEGGLLCARRRDREDREGAFRTA